MCGGITRGDSRASQSEVARGVRKLTRAAYANQLVRKFDIMSSRKGKGGRYGKNTQSDVWGNVLGARSV